MALLTAEDVINKAFSRTKYREGFDQDEVDDFLDEVAATITALTEERDRLERGAKSGASSRGAEAPASTGATRLVQAATDPTADGTPTGMLAMAQKFHDEYVRSGEEERDRIIFDATTEADRIRARAEREAGERLEDLSRERAELERKIDDLRRFERDYRSRLKGYLENLLGDLDHGQGRDRMPNSAPEL